MRHRIAMPVSRRAALHRPALRHQIAEPAMPQHHQQQPSTPSRSTSERSLPSMPRLTFAALTNSYRNDTSAWQLGGRALTRGSLAAPSFPFLSPHLAPAMCDEKFTQVGCQYMLFFWL